MTIELFTALFLLAPGQMAPASQPDITQDFDYIRCMRAADVEGDDGPTNRIKRHGFCRAIALLDPSVAV